MTECRLQTTIDNERLRQLQEAEAACEAEAFAAAQAVEYRNELRHRLDIQVTAVSHCAALSCAVLQWLHSFSDASRFACDATCRRKTVLCS